jgi:hypothetical protein
MKTVAETPTTPANYALISGVYGVALAGVAAAARRRGHAPRAGELVPLGAATFTFTRVLTEQKVEEWLRRPFVDERPDGTKRPKGRGLRYAVGELLSCTRCTGSWVGLGLVGLHVASPASARVVASVGTVGALNDTALAGFAWATQRANAAAAEAERAAAADAPD